MDQKRLVMAIAISLAIMLGFQYFVAPYLPKTAPPPVEATTNAPATLSSPSGTPGPIRTAPECAGVGRWEPRSDEPPNYVQYGGTAPPGEAVTLPKDDTVWTASGGPLTTARKVTLSWENGQGVTFLIEFAIDDEYMFAVR